MMDNIVLDENILGGIPCYKGTRIPVEMIEALVIYGLSVKEISELYPSLPLDYIKENNEKDFRSN
jgi:uncharacterized protein (DUF433 family)